MSVMQFAYIFDWEAFQREAEPLVKSVDGGSVESLVGRSVSILERVRRARQQWLLEPAYGAMADIDQWPKPFTPPKIGYCFLAILSEHLRESPASLLGEWPLLHAGLTAVGWSERDAMLPTRGWYTQILLRPDREIDLLERPLTSGNVDRDTRTHDFAWWVRSDSDAGWVDTRTTRGLQERLLPLRSRLLQLTPQQLARDAYPTIAPDYVATSQLVSSYDCALTMLGAAVAEDKGLFFAIS